MFKKNRCILQVVALSAMLAASQASWSAQIFFGEDRGLGEFNPLLSFSNARAAEANFLSFLIDRETEDFESFAPESIAPLQLNFTSVGTATLEGGGLVTNTTPGTTNGYGRYGASGSQYWETSSSSFSISFSTPIAAFGFYGIDIGDFLGQVTISTNNGPQNYNVGNALAKPGGSMLFWGLIDTVNPFTRISFGNTAADSDVFGFDDMTIGSLAQVASKIAEPASFKAAAFDFVKVPEPTSLALLGLGLAGLGLTRRRRT